MIVLVNAIKLVEASKSELLNKSKHGSDKAKMRYNRRTKSRESTSMKSYSEINMNEFFKQDILTFDVPVQGETNNYVVTLSFPNVLFELSKIMKNENYRKTTFKDIYRAIMNAYNKSGSVYNYCTCPDFEYRFAYWATKNDTITKKKQFIPADITNPNDLLGSTCKHSLLVLSNTQWAMKIARVIQNYIDYCEKNLQKAYADIIYPRIYGKTYDQIVQLGIFDDDVLDKDVIQQANIEKQKSTQFQKGNQQGIRFAKEPPENLQKEIEKL